MSENITESNLNQLDLNKEGESNGKFDLSDIQDLINQGINENGNNKGTDLLKKSFDNISEGDKLNIINSLKKSLPLNIDKKSVYQTYAIQIILKLSGDSSGGLNGSWGKKTETAYQKIFLKQNLSQPSGQDPVFVENDPIMPTHESKVSPEIYGETTPLKEGVIVQEPTNQESVVAENKVLKEKNHICEKGKEVEYIKTHFKEVKKFKDLPIGEIVINGTTYTVGAMETSKENALSYLTGVTGKKLKYIGGINNSIHITTEKTQEEINTEEKIIRDGKIKALSEEISKIELESGDKNEIMKKLLGNIKLFEVIPKTGIGKLNINGKNYYINQYPIELDNNGAIKDIEDKTGDYVNVMGTLETEYRLKKMKISIFEEDVEKKLEKIEEKKERIKVLNEQIKLEPKRAGELISNNTDLFENIPYSNVKKLTLDGTNYFFTDVQNNSLFINGGERDIRGAITHENGVKKGNVFISSLEVKGVVSMRKRVLLENGKLRIFMKQDI